jgi:iron complex outermembrane receptor protein
VVAYFFPLTLFHADYDHLRTQEFRLNPTVVFSPTAWKARKMETWGTVDVMRGWRLSAGYSKLHRSLEPKPGSVDTAALATVGSDPAQRWTLRSSHDLPGQVEFDAIVRHASALANPRVPGYVAVDVRLGWSPRSDLELSVAGQNLFDPGHGEFANAATRSELGRTVFFRVLGRF